MIFIILIKDGRICRVSFRIQTDKIDSIPTETTKTKSKHLSRSHSRQSLHRPNFENLVLSSSSNPSLASAINTNATGQIDLLPGYPLGRQRHQLIRTARGRTGIILGSRPLIPAASVPEELIEQVINTTIYEKIFQARDSSTLKLRFFEDYTSYRVFHI